MSNDNKIGDKNGFSEYMSRCLTRSKSIMALCVVLVVVLAGCSSISGFETATQTPTSTPENTISTETSTPTTTATLTPSPTATPEPSRLDKQRFFAENYTDNLEENHVNVTRTAIDNETETLFLTYQMRDPENDQITGDEEKNVSIWYAATANAYVKFGFNESWIPKQVNVTAIAPDGYVFETGYLKYEWAEKLRNDEIDAFRYLAKYYNTTECGPKYPECE